MMKTDSIQNHSYNKNNVSFGSIKSIKFEGLYKKYPELGKELIDSFEKNTKALEFCKKYDVDIVFYAVKQGMDSVNSYVHILYDNIAKSKFKKFITSFNGTEDKVSLSFFGNKYNVAGSLKESTSALKAAIAPQDVSNLRAGNGMLESHLRLADEEIQTALAKKAAKVIAKKAKIELQANNNSKLNENSRNLEDSIKKLIDKSN